MDKLEKRWVNSDTLLCVGLDSNYDLIPKIVKETARNNLEDCVFDFNCQIVNATADLVCAFKPNIAFYENLGLDGMRALIRTNEYIHNNYPDIPIILDAKRGDIDNTNKGYIHAVFDVFKADAVTVHPYLGREAIRLFLDQKRMGIFILCRTSNPGAGELQDLLVKDGDKEVRLYQLLALNVAKYWNDNRNCGLVMGATYPNEIYEVRKLVGDLPFLVPGIGSQAGDLKKTLLLGLDSRNSGLIINSSRNIIFASSGSDYLDAARREALILRDEINKWRQVVLRN
jgi:orotidine-5'-phosphate decarboxylase